MISKRHTRKVAPTRSLAEVGNETGRQRELYEKIRRRTPHRASHRGWWTSPVKEDGKWEVTDRDSTIIELKKPGSAYSISREKQRATGRLGAGHEGQGKRA